MTCPQPTPSSGICSMHWNVKRRKIPTRGNYNTYSNLTFRAQCRKGRSLALSEAIMKGQRPPQCLPPLMWSEEEASVSIEAAGVWLGDNTALLATGETNTNAISFSVFRSCSCNKKKIWVDRKAKAHKKFKWTVNRGWGTRDTPTVVMMSTPMQIHYVYTILPPPTTHPLILSCSNTLLPFKQSKVYLSRSFPLSFWFSLSQWKEKAALINRSESFSTPQWFQAQLGKLNIIKAQGKGCTFLEIAGGVVQEVACYRRRHVAMHVQYSMPGHRGSTEPQPWEEEEGVEERRMAAITEWGKLSVHVFLHHAHTLLLSGCG